MKNIFFIIFMLASIQSRSQISLNVNLLAKINPDTAADFYYSGIWGYAAPDGKEYALLGANHGTYFIDVTDSTNIHTVAFLKADDSHWREIKIVNHYAYIGEQVFSNTGYLQIVNLDYLPDSVHLEAIFDSTFKTIHTLSIDVLGDDHYIYINGPLDVEGNSGVHILDISNSVHPVEVGRYSTAWIHDSHIRGNLLYACDFNAGNIDIVDISDKRNPTLIAQINNCGYALHSCWTTADGDYLMTCNEADAFPSHIYDVRDFENITEVANYRGDTTAVVHNTYIKNNFAYIANDVGGFRVVDITKPNVPVEVGYYDTYTDSLTHSHGCFGAYPFLPSGKILASDRESGLYVFRYIGIMAGRIYGKVIDKNNQPIIRASVTLNGTNEKTLSDLGGNFKFGALPNNCCQYSLSCNANGFWEKKIFNITLHASDSLFYLIKLDSVESNTVHSLSLNENVVDDELIFTVHDVSTEGAIEIINCTGEIIFSGKVYLTNENSIIETAISNRSNGIYFLHYHSLTFDSVLKFAKQ